MSEGHQEPATTRKQGQRKFWTGSSPVEAKRSYCWRKQMKISSATHSKSCRRLEEGYLFFWDKVFGSHSSSTTANHVHHNKHTISRWSMEAAPGMCLSSRSWMACRDVERNKNKEKYHQLLEDAQTQSVGGLWPERKLIFFNFLLFFFTVSAINSKVLADQRRQSEQCLLFY